jgi:hypothetical protein
MFRTSKLAHEESRIFEELLSRFDSLGDEQMLAVGVTPEWSAKDLLARCAPDSQAGALLSPAQKVRLARLRNKPPKASLPPSTPMCSARC